MGQKYNLSISVIIKKFTKGVSFRHKRYIFGIWRVFLELNFSALLEDIIFLFCFFFFLRLLHRLYICMFIITSVSDPFHFDGDPDPQIRIRDNGSGSGSGSGSQQIPFFFS